MKKIVIAFLSLVLFARCSSEKILSEAQQYKLKTDEIFFELADKNTDLLFLRIKDTTTNVEARDFIVSIQDINENNEIKSNIITRSDLASDDTHLISLFDIPQGTYIAKLYRSFGNGKACWQRI